MNTGAANEKKTRLAVVAVVVICVLAVALFTVLCPRVSSPKLLSELPEAELAAVLDNYDLGFIYAYGPDGMGIDDFRAVFKSVESTGYTGLEGVSALYASRYSDYCKLIVYEYYLEHYSEYCRGDKIELASKDRLEEIVRIYHESVDTYN